MVVLQRHVENSEAQNDPFEDSKSMLDQSLSYSQFFIEAKAIDDREAKELSKQKGVIMLNHEGYQEPMRVIQQLVDQSFSANDPFASDDSMCEEGGKSVLLLVKEGSDQGFVD